LYDSAAIIPCKGVVSMVVEFHTQSSTVMQQKV
jgi:hypothetical protein